MLETSGRPLKAPLLAFMQPTAQEQGHKEPLGREGRDSRQPENGVPGRPVPAASDGPQPPRVSVAQAGPRLPHGQHHLQSGPSGTQGRAVPAGVTVGRKASQEPGARACNLCLTLFLDFSIENANKG